MIDKRIWICAAILLLAATTGTAAALEDIEQLGKSIFFDQNLSIQMNQSCASCHDPEVGWTGPISDINEAGAVYEGSIPDSFGDRKPPSAAYATTSPILHYELKDKKPALFIGGNFWDGRATGEKLGNPAADQAQGPFLNPKEQAFNDSACVVYRVCNATDYPVSFEDVWGNGTCNINWPEDIEDICASEDGIVVLTSPGHSNKSDEAYDNIALSIAAYEASPEVNAFTSKWDYSRIGMATLSKEERNGFALFQSKGKCAGCHITKDKKPLLTDYTFDNLGFPENLENPVYDYNSEFVDFGLGGFLNTTDNYWEFAGDNMGKQKVPTLRNVGLGSCEAGDYGYEYDPCIIKAYGHNGYFKSLKDIVHFYNTRDEPWPGEYWPAPEVDDNVNMDELGNLGLTDAEEDAIVAFMMTLSDGFVP